MSEAIPSWARIGAKVVCIKTARSDVVVPGYHYPEVGEIYTIRDVVFVTIGDRAGQYSLFLREITNPPMVFGSAICEEPSLPIDVFRPLVSQADDVATHFAQHLNTRAPETV